MSSCCTDFAKALEDGTDNEGYGPAIHSDYGKEKFFLGDIETPLRFCPWCGARLITETSIR